VPEHFHLTEVGVVTKNFIDCGGTVRSERVANFQLWDANDSDHRLKPQKLLNINVLLEKALDIQVRDQIKAYSPQLVADHILDEPAITK
jgi:hypothetical protein